MSAEQVTKRLLEKFGSRESLRLSLGELLELCGATARRRAGAVSVLAKRGFSVTIEGEGNPRDVVTVRIVDPRFGGKISRADRAPYINAERSASRSDALQRRSKLKLERGQTYRVLSIQPPWAWAIFCAGKDIENRSWTTKHRGPLLIHASSKKFVGELLQDTREEIADSAGLDLAEVPTEFPRSQLLGLVEVTNVTTSSRSRWAQPGSYHWALRDRRVLAKAVTGVDGKLNLWSWTA